MTPKTISGLLMGLGVMAISIAAFAERCPNGLINEGITKYEVLMKCGEPTFTDERTEERVTKTGEGSHTRYTVEIEEWTYNFGSRKFLRILTFHSGKLIRIATRGYGTDAPVPSSKDPGRQVQTGDTKFEVLNKLGTPVDKNRQEIQRKERTKDGTIVITTTVRETWTFDLGSNRFIRFVEFENGRVVRIETGGYGAK
jgi:hypothetical protein